MNQAREEGWCRTVFVYTKLLNSEWWEKSLVEHQILVLIIRRPTVDHWHSEIWQLGTYDIKYQLHNISK